MRYVSSSIGDLALREGWSRDLVRGNGSLHHKGKKLPAGFLGDASVVLIAKVNCFRGRRNKGFVSGTNGKRAPVNWVIKGVSSLET